MKPSYRYEAEVLKVKDGDTIVVRIDLGFDTLVRQELRIAGINAAEVHTKNLAEKAIGLRGEQFVADWVSKHPVVIVETVAPKEKFGRYLANVFGLDGEDLAAALVGAGLAKAWDGKGARPTFT